MFWLIELIYIKYFYSIFKIIEVLNFILSKSQRYLHELKYSYGVHYDAWGLVQFLLLVVHTILFEKRKKNLSLELGKRCSNSKMQIYESHDSG